MEENREPRPIDWGCLKCYGTLTFPTPWIGKHAGEITCDCPGARERYGDRAGSVWPGGNDHRLKLLLAHGRAAWVDVGIMKDIRRLWSAGIWTWVSCQGNGKCGSRYVGLLDPGRVDEARALLPWAAETLVQPFRAAIYGGHCADCQCLGGTLLLEG